MTDSTISTPVSAPNPNFVPPTSGSGTGTSTPGIADNFQTFLTLLTTQLQNQNPLDPLDTNQFTQQLVQFAGIEQQMKGNDALASLVSIDKSAQSTQALVFVGQNVAVDGSTAQFDGKSATWNLNAPKDASTTITITSPTGATAYSGPFTLSAGNASFVWDGKGNDGSQWPAGAYKMSVVGTDSTGANVAVSTEVQGVVDSVDLTQSPPLLSIGGQNYTTDQIKRIVRQGTNSSGSGSGTGSGTGGTGSTSS
jgi:flagellar basal-body rod modification protein FlgD